jgi:hypothetical protein
MTLKQFMLTCTIDARGKKSYWPPISDLSLVVVGIIWTFIAKDYTIYIGAMVTIINIFCFIAQVYNYRHDFSQRAMR